MREILRALPPGSRVLDLGSGMGSFGVGDFDLTVVRADIEAPQREQSNFVVCTSSRLPFAKQSFRAVILNHSLEHFENLEQSVTEIASVLAPDAFVYIAVPDASTFTDRVYRWLAHGGGHVNSFTDPETIPRMITAATGLTHAGTRVLHTSLSFLNRYNIASRPPRKLLLFAYGHEGFLRLLTYALRRLDSCFRWRTSVYGWAFYLGRALAPQLDAWSNVCVRCGSGHPSSLLVQSGKLTQRKALLPMYVCPDCGAHNFFTDDWKISV